MKHRLGKKILSNFLVLVMMVTLVPYMPAKQVEAASGNDVVRVAQEQLGYVAGAGNYNKYGEYFGSPKSNWCAYFVAWCMKEAGVGTNVYNYTSSNVNLGYAVPNESVKSGIWHQWDYTSDGGYAYIPKGGDLLYIDWSTDGWESYPDHIELIVSCSNGIIHTVSGNSSCGQGRGVVSHTFSVDNAQIKGICEVDYTGRSSAVARPVWKVGPRNGAGNSNSGSGSGSSTPDSYPVPIRNIKAGCSGNDVKWVQSMLNRLTNANLSVDGIAGQATKRAIINYQSSRGLQADGIVGYNTRNRIISDYEASKIIAATSISLSASSIELTVGNTTQLSANVGPANATNKSVTWASGNPSVATVSNGVVKAVKEGTTTISATTHNGKTASCTVKVHNPIIVKFVDADGTLLDQQSVQWGGSANVPKSPAKEGYTFSRWEGTYQNLKSDSTVTAIYTKNKYKVTFKETDGTKIGETQTVPYDEAATEPSEESLAIPDGYKLQGWSEKFDHVKSDMTIYPIYEWADANLPLEITAEENACKPNYDEGMYSLSFVIKNHSSETKNAKVMTYMSTDGGKLVAQGETRTVRVPADGEKDVSDMVITCKAAADKVRIVVLDDYASAVPLAEIKDVNVEAAGYGEWSDTAPTDGQTDYMERTIYRSKKVNYTTSTTTSSINGWTKYNQTLDHYNYGAWNWAGNGRDVRSNDTTKSEWITYDVDPFIFAEPQGNVCSGSGGHIYWIQACLIRCGFWVDLDGIWGANTRAAVKNFQASKGLSADGIVGAQTRQAMKDQVNSQPLYNYYTRTQTPVYKYYFYCLDSNWSDWSVTKIEGDTKVNAGTSKLIVETAKQYRYKEINADESGNVMTADCKLPEDAMNLAGKDAVAIVFKNKVNQIAEDNVQYIGNTKINTDGTINLSFVPREVQTYEGTGDYTIVLGVKGTSNYVKVGTLEAPKPQYKVAFVDADGTMLSEQLVEEGKNAELPETPSKEGYVFAGWDTGITNIHSDLTIMAQYAKEKHTVTYVDWENKTIDQKQYEYGDLLELPKNPKAPEGKTFVGWSAEEGQKITEDIVCEAQFEVPKYTVTFVDNDGKVVQQQVVEEGQPAMEPIVDSEITKTQPADSEDETAGDGRVPERVDNMSFVSWGEGIDLSSITTNLVVGAIYQYDETVATPTASVTSGEYDEAQTIALTSETEGAIIYYTLDGSDPSDVENIDAVQLYESPFTITDKTKLKFYAVKMGMNDSRIGEEWYCINQTGNIPMHLLNIQSVNTYDMTVVSDYRDFVKDGVLLDLNTLLAEEYESVELEGLYYDADFTEKWQEGSQTITESLNLYAKYDARKYTVTYLDEAGNLIQTGKTEYGMPVDADVAPQKEGYRFIGWESEDDPDCVTKDITVTAKYIQDDEYKVIQFGRKSYSVMEGTSFKLNPKVTYEATGNVAADETIIWKSSNSDYAVVDDLGNVTALAKGEVTVYARLVSSGEVAECTIKITGNPETSICLLSNSSYKLQNNYLNGIPSGKNSVAEVRKQINADDLRFCDDQNIVLKDDELVGTGTRIQMLDDTGAILDEVVVVIHGDYNGDGIINGKDVSGITRCLIGIETANEVRLRAMDVNGDGYVNNRDAAMLSRYLVGKEDL